MKRLCIALALFLGLAVSASAQPKLGVVGDSLIDEYSDQTEFGLNLGYAQNGFELMVLNGRVDGGSTGSWGGTRNNGFEYNWALAGSTTSSLISNNQHTNLAAQVPGAGITKAVMVVGANDLFPELPVFGSTGSPGSNYEAIYEGLATQGDIDNIAAQAIANVVLAAQTIKASGVDLIVATAPDYGIAPFTKNFYPDPAKRQAVDDVIEFWNSEATTQLTQDVGVPVVDLYSLSKDIFGDHGSENLTFELGGVDLDLLGTGGVDFADVLNGTFNPADATSDTEDAFLHDGIHPNTALSGIFANLFMTGFNQEFDDELVLFSEQELLQFGGSTLGAQYTNDTFVNSLGGKNYGDYVISAVPEPSAAVILGAFGMLAFFRRRAR